MGKMQRHLRTRLGLNISKMLIVLAFFTDQHWSVKAQPQGVCNTFRRQYDSCEPYAEDSSRNLCYWEGSTFLCNDCNQPFTGVYCCEYETCQPLQHCQGTIYNEGECELQADGFVCGHRTYESCVWNNDDETFCCSGHRRHEECDHDAVLEHECEVTQGGYQCGHRTYELCSFNVVYEAFCCTSHIIQATCPEGSVKRESCTEEGDRYRCGSRWYRTCMWNVDVETFCCSGRIWWG